MKAYTDLGQSKKLVEILPVESADNYYAWHDERYYVVNKDCPYPYSIKEKIPCWSLAALLDVLPCDWWGYNKHYFLEISKMGDISAPYIVSYFRFREQSDGADFDRITHISFQSDNLIDACYEMIIKLHELNLL